MKHLKYLLVNILYFKFFKFDTLKKILIFKNSFKKLKYNFLNILPNNFIKVPIRPAFRIGLGIAKKFKEK